MDICDMYPKNTSTMFFYSLMKVDINPNLKKSVCKIFKYQACKPKCNGKGIKVLRLFLSVFCKDHRSILVA